MLMAGGAAFVTTRGCDMQKIRGAKRLRRKRIGATARQLRRKFDAVKQLRPEQMVVIDRTDIMLVWPP